MKIAIMMANGCEEIEGLTTVDILRRAGVTIDMIAVSENLTITGSHGIAFECDRRLMEADFLSYDGMVLPGGLPGTDHLGENEVVVKYAKEYAASGKLVAAICAAPRVLGDNGILEGKKATCYPGNEDRLKGAEVITDQPVVRDGNIITSRGMGTATPFALALAAYTAGEEKAAEIEKGIIWG